MYLQVSKLLIISLGLDWYIFFIFSELCSKQLLLHRQVLKKFPKFFSMHFQMLIRHVIIFSS